MPMLSVLGRRTTALLIAAVVAVVVSFILVLSGAPAVITFAATAVGWECWRVSSAKAPTRSVRG